MSGKAFRSGFSGCFGVLAAFVLVGVVVAVVARAISALPSQPTTDEPPTLATLENVGHCLNGMAEAVEDGRAKDGTTAMITPWAIWQAAPGPPLQLACNMKANGRRVLVTVDILCADSERPACSRLRAYEPTTTPAP